MTPCCSRCGRTLIPWRPLQPVNLDHGRVVDRRYEVCPPCRRVYRTTLTVWLERHHDQWPSEALWRLFDRAAT